MKGEGNPDLTAGEHGVRESIMFPAAPVDLRFPEYPDCLHP